MSDADDQTTAAPGTTERRSPAFLATAVALPLAVVACFVVFLVLAQQKQGEARDAAEAGHLKSIAAPSSGDGACAKLLGAIPADLDGFRRTGDDEPGGFARWSGEKAGAVEVRCGTDRPADLSATSKLQIINGVQWLQATPAGAPAPDGGSYWTAVDHRPYVTLWVPDGAGTSAVQATSDAIREHLQAASLDLGR
ncbi:DUF3515 domain-containing protein [Tsukamurella paurometabola]|uniref:Protein of uncharacterized function (DUF3515) n=1 Tax=Tsukamurella paurometabola TaxID=2061 RepID=A0A3P8LFR5_TSUPA|nr:DUF3515 domain-containing protein [Tsukamurella paurometabola]UEA82829.1 DUF3515 domain-containing protein [Tsukamurella paurometabola]VDR39902.1 Protein of uncharacterised function (DUF3515) [Tsukamurella paurometabola]